MGICYFWSRCDTENNGCRWDGHIHRYEIHPDPPVGALLVLRRERMLRFEDFTAGVTWQLSSGT